MPGNQTLLHWNRHPKSDGFNEINAAVDFNPVSPGAGVVNTTVQAAFLIPFLYKIRKVGVFYSAVDSVAGTDKFNIVVGTGAYTQGVIAPNDNSYASGLVVPAAASATTGAGVYVAQSGAGYPTNVATAGMAVFSADITVAPAATTAQQPGAATNGPYAPGWIAAATGGGYGIFVPPNYDAVYPMLVPLTLRMVTTASTGSATAFTVTLGVVPVTPLASPGSGSTAAAPFVIPGQQY
jgi:hypothetical protein